MARAELKIVVDQVEADLWPDKDMIGYVHADAASKGPHEMPLACVVGAPGEGATDRVWLVVPNALVPDASQQFGCQALPDLRRPDPIEIPEEGTEGLISVSLRNGDRFRPGTLIGIRQES